MDYSLEELLKFKEEHGYPLGFESKEQYEEWLSKAKERASAEAAHTNAASPKTTETPRVDTPPPETPKVKTTPIGAADDIADSVKATGKVASKADDVAKLASKADDVAKLTDKLADSATKSIPKGWAVAGGIVSGIVVAGTLTHVGISMHNKSKERKQQRIQENYRRKKQKEFDSFDKDLYYSLEELDGLPQQLYSNRNGHSNTWGGRRY